MVHKVSLLHSRSTPLATAGDCSFTHWHLQYIAPSCRVKHDVLLMTPLHDCLLCRADELFALNILSSHQEQRREKVGTGSNSTM